MSRTRSVWESIFMTLLQRFIKWTRFSFPSLIHWCENECFRATSVQVWWYSIRRQTSTITPVCRTIKTSKCTVDYWCFMIQSYPWSLSWSTTFIWGRVSRAWVMKEGQQYLIVKGSQNISTVIQYEYIIAFCILCWVNTRRIRMILDYFVAKYKHRSSFIFRSHSWKYRRYVSYYFYNNKNYGMWEME